MRYKITAPVAGVTNKVAGVNLVDGVGETDNENAVAYFKRHGYTVEEVRAPELAADAEGVTDVPEMPKKSASTDVWRAWAVHPKGGALSEEEASDLSRAEIIGRFTKPSEPQPPAQGGDGGQDKEGDLP